MASGNSKRKTRNNKDSSSPTTSDERIPKRRSHDDDLEFKGTVASSAEESSAEKLKLDFKEMMELAAKELNDTVAKSIAEEFKGMVKSGAEKLKLDLKEMMELAAKEIKDTLVKFIAEEFKGTGKSSAEKLKGKEESGAEKLKGKEESGAEKSKLDYNEMMKLTAKELKDNSELCSIDDAFYLSREKNREISKMFSIPGWSCTPEKYMNWNVYARAFYLKLLSCRDNKEPFSYKSLTWQECVQLLKEEITPEEEEEHLRYLQSLEEPAVSIQQADEEEQEYARKYEMTGPIIFGSYSPENEPQQIPYHLYLLVKEVTDIMKPHHSNSIDESKLILVEEKISFFCRYFNCHLPTGWKYNRDDASSVVASYDTTRQPRYNMEGYAPFSFSSAKHVLEFDSELQLTRQDLSAVMCVIHSRETPAIWQWSLEERLFYCKICSCFGIDYHRLEAASKDDVSLMDVGLRPPSPSVSPWY